ncbi:MAG: hypothetical protein MI754_08140, partial [Chromatiales bacterium]|nr:hypothetical protein [Chromatiales bacterium]
GSLDEMRKLSSAVKQYSADDEVRMERVAAKLEKREQSQIRYIEFQKQEKEFTRPPQFIKLAYTVVEELDDAAYAGQLLNSAEEKLREGPYSLTQFLPFTVAVDALTNDADWVARLLDEAAEHAEHFPAVKVLGETVTQELRPRDSNREWLCNFYQKYLEKLASSNASAFEFLKMARAIKQHLQDREWTEKTLDLAIQHAQNHFHYAYIAEQMNQWDEGDRADALYSQAAEACSDSKELTELVQLARKAGVDETKLRDLYARGEQLSDAWQKLRWAEGIVDLFDDKEWAGSVYEKLRPSFEELGAIHLLESSRDSHMHQHKLY